MTNFISIPIRERVEGAPGFYDPHEFTVTINPDQVTVVSEGEDPKTTFIRMSCGVTLCVVMPKNKFLKYITE